MDLPESFQCRACQSFLSHPIDNCPVCGDQLYWMLVWSEEPDDLQRKDYLDRVIALVDGRASREFLTHGDLLWLPHRFWDCDPTGELLDTLDWVTGIELHQHDAEDRRAAPDDEFDTLPKMPIPKYVAETVHGEAVETLRARVVPERAEERNPPDATQPVAPAASTPRSEPGVDTPLARGSSRVLSADLFVPLMIFLFLCLLSLSYLVLRYHKNTRAQPAAAAPTEEVSNDANPVLP